MQIKIGKRKFLIIDSNLLSNPTQRNIKILMTERTNLIFHNKVINGTNINRLIRRIINLLAD